MHLLNGHVSDWTLNFDDVTFLRSQPILNVLDLGLKILSYRFQGEFLSSLDLDMAVISYVSDQLDLPERLGKLPELSSRRERERRKLIRNYLNIEPFNNDTGSHLKDWLEADPNMSALTKTEFEAVVCNWCLKQKVSKPRKNMA